MSADPLPGPTDGLSPVSAAARWSGRVISGLVVLFMLMGAGMNLSGSKTATDGLQQMGYPESVGFPIGIALLASTILYALPKTSVLGAILLTGYLGGAVATHVRAGEGVGSFIPALVFGALVWLGPLLRDRRLRDLLPLTTKQCESAKG